MLSRRIVVALLAGLIAVPVTAAPAAAAPIIRVTTLSTTIADDGLCSLPEAVGAANNDTASGTLPGECTAGDAADWIEFDPVGTILLFQRLTITEDLTIAGGGRITLLGSEDDALVSTEAGTNVTLDGLRLTKGRADYGGAIASFGASLTIIDSEIFGNTANANGGGISISGTGLLIVIDSTIRDNTAAQVGGGINVASVGASAYVYSSTLSGNHAGIAGGGLAAVGPVTVANTTVASNSSASFGAGVYLNGAEADGTILNTTITGNTQPSPDNGPYGLSASTLATVAVRNTLIVGNGSDDVASIEMDTISNSIVDAPATGILDPAGLQANGGPTKTVRLVAGSGAIGAGDPAICANQPVGGKDQRGVVRPAGVGCDIGATERETVAPTMTKAPVASLRTGVALSGSSLRVRLSFGATDAAGGSGVVGYQVYRSVNGGSYSKVATVSGRTADFTLPTGRSYRFKVRAFDGDRTLSGFLTGPTFTTRLVQQSSSSVTYRGTWRTRTSSVFSGGSARYATARGASVTFTATGRAFAFVSTLGLERGKAKVYVDGTYVTTIDLLGDSPNTYRAQVWATRFSSSRSHTVKVVVLGTSGRPRIDADALAVLR